MIIIKPKQRLIYISSPRSSSAKYLSILD
ncbi:hypothetical protein Goshw_004017 [Gossypium schwendimanii]|uniref:Uncharacterized protein n=1 Tax=Gossypium schwendimanii TaxID=34291 RepID=A0A7J9NCT9_GOSSC|nr:hypothetical protein [Gossypium schwendimanii]